MRDLLTFRHDSASENAISLASLIEKLLWVRRPKLLTEMLIGLRHGLGWASFAA